MAATMTDTVYIFGTGRSLLALDAEERAYLDAHPRTLGMNRYYLHYERLGILPRMLFLSDFNYYADLILRRCIERLQHLGHALPYYVSETYPQFYRTPAWRHPVRKRRLRRQLMQQHGYRPEPLPAYDHLVPFPVSNEAPRFHWARDLSQPLYHRRGSLTVAINLVNILHPGCDVKLLGIDLSDAGYFYDEMITDSNRDLWVDDKYDRSVREGRHANARPKRHDDFTLCDAMRAVRGEFDRQGRRLLCCNPRSLLVTDGILDDAQVIG